MSDTPEHARIVDDACTYYLGHLLFVKVREKTFTLGEISALAGDFYEEPGSLLEGDAAALAPAVS